jgi:hypothetical protein
MPDDHFLAPPQVTAMDDQFGTHRLEPGAHAAEVRATDKTGYT